MSQEMSSILESSKCPKQFVDFLTRIECFDVESFALLSSSEDKLKTELIDKSNTLDDDDFMGVVFVKRAWSAARNSWNIASGSGSSGPAIPDNSLPPHVAEKLLKTWKARYYYQLGGARLVTDTLIA